MFYYGFNKYLLRRRKIVVILLIINIITESTGLISVLSPRRK